MERIYNKVRLLDKKYLDLNLKRYINEGYYILEDSYVCKGDLLRNESGQCFEVVDCIEDYHEIEYVFMDDERKRKVKSSIIKVKEGLLDGNEFEVITYTKMFCD